MADLTSLSLQLDNKTCICRAIIETPKGCRNKFDYDPETGLFMLGGLLPEGMMFPFDFGFLPSTLGEDGDPLDIMVLMDAPAHVGCLIEVRIIGIITAEQTEDGKTESNDRLLGVAVHSYDHEDQQSIKDVSKTLLDQVEEFFVSYNKQRGKKFKDYGHRRTEEGDQIPEKRHKGSQECRKEVGSLIAGSTATVVTNYQGGNIERTLDRASFAKRPEPCANILCEQFRFFQRGEVAAPRNLRPALHVEEALRPFTGRAADIRREERERRRDFGGTGPLLHPLLDPGQRAGIREIVVGQERRTDRLRCPSKS